MADGCDNMKKGAMPVQGAEVLQVQDNAEEYLLILLDRERQLAACRATIHSQEQELQMLLGRIEEKERTVDELRSEVDALRAELEAARGGRSARGGDVQGKIMPLVPYDMEGSDTDTDPLPSPTRRMPHRRAVRIDNEVVARLKNDRKAYPVVCDKALQYWQMLADAGLIDHRLKPTSRCGVTVMARIVSRMQTEVDPAISWAFFERYWDCDHLQSNLHRETYKHRGFYATVNRVFGLADDAPYQTKSSQAV